MIVYILFFIYNYIINLFKYLKKSRYIISYPEKLAYNLENNDQIRKTNNHYEKSGKLHQRAFNSFIKRVRLLFFFFY